MKLFETSDYAGLEFDNFKFYYGYEEVVCSIHDSFEECGEADCSDNEWAFVAWENGKEVLRLSQSELEKAVDEILVDSNAQYVLAGVGIFMSKRL